MLARPYPAEKYDRANGKIASAAVSWSAVTSNFRVQPGQRREEIQLSSAHW